jgi:septum formation protein
VNEESLVGENPHWQPETVSVELAKAKALDVSSRNDASLVVGADQVLCCGATTYGKPKSLSHCRRQLLELRGKEHCLVSSVALARGGEIAWQHTATARLTMRRFTDEFLDSYLDSSGPEILSSVGGYKIEGLGIQLFESVEGDYFTILGLPLLPLLAYLRHTGELAR